MESNLMIHPIHCLIRHCYRCRFHLNHFHSLTLSRFPNHYPNQNRSRYLIHYPTHFPSFQSYPIHLIQMIHEHNKQSHRSALHLRLRGIASRTDRSLESRIR
jgi:hypothetical protein